MTKLDLLLEYIDQQVSADLQKEIESSAEVANWQRIMNAIKLLRSDRE
ncbi:MAG: hypothetical protein ISR65_07385 [Bacteriovoracaceae bacterium]|nr:hypothetical protein [Bacteriovoracaceae bacterium]